jgi:hypothetical protein
MLRLVLAAWLALCGVANAQMNGGVQFPGPGTAHSSGAAFSLTWQDYQAQVLFPASSATLTFTGMGIGTADANRVVAVGIFVQGFIGTVTGVTIGGVSATQVTGAAASVTSIQTDIWYASVPTGTTATVVVTMNTSQQYSMAVTAFRIITATPTAGTGGSGTQGFGTTASATVTIPSGGGAIFLGQLDGSQTQSWNVATVDNARTTTGANGTSSYDGHITGLSGSQTNTITIGASDRIATSAAPWGP